MTLVLAAATLFALAQTSGADPGSERLELIASSMNPLRAHAGETRFLRSVAEPGALPGFMVGRSIRVYQLLLSSQDEPSCQFVPSCSRYCSQAISQRGLLKGALMCADRVMRCHPGASARYPRDLETGLAIDPPVVLRNHEED